MSHSCRRCHIARHAAHAPGQREKNIAHRHGVSSPCQCCWPAAEAFAWGSAFAQTATSTFDEVNARLRPGDRVTVTDAQQRTISGRVEEISTSSLRMMVDAKRQDFALHDLLRIERRTSDSLLIGALIGAAIGGALF